MQLGLENKKKMVWLAVLGPLAILAFAYEVIPMFTGSSSEPGSSAQAAVPSAPAARLVARPGAKGKKVRVENLDPTLRLDLLALSEKTQYEGSGRNIFISQAEPLIQHPMGNGTTDHPEGTPGIYKPPPVPASIPIPLKFFGFASKPGEPKKIFLEQNGDIWVAGEGEVVNRRYKVLHISPNSVEIQDLVGSGPSQNIPLTLG